MEYLAYVLHTDGSEGAPIPISISSNDSVCDVRRSVAEALKLQLESFDLYLGEEKLEGDASVKETALTAGSELHVRRSKVFEAREILRARKKPPNQRTLLSAIASKDKDLVTLCLDAKIDPNGDPEASLSSTPLHLAAGSSTPDIIQLLIERGAEANHACLHSAVVWAKVQNITKLLEWVPVDGLDNSNRTPLSYASRKEVAEVLLEHRADPNARCDAGRTPLYYALLQLDPQIPMEQEQRMGFFNLLYERGGDLTTKCRRQRGLLHEAAMIGWESGVLKLKEKGVDVNGQDRGGRTPLHIAVRSVCFKGGIVKALLDAGADPNIKDKQGQTPLMLVRHSPGCAADCKSHFEPLLKACGERVSDVDFLGRTALHRAASSGNVVLAELLLKFGANPVAKRNRDDLTPLEVAKKGNHKKVIQVLKAHLKSTETGTSEHSTAKK